MKRLQLGFALWIAVTVVGCKDIPTTCGIPDSTQECGCSDGRTGGSQTCRDEAWTECVCPGEPIVGADASDDGAVDGGTDSGARTDSGDTDSGARTDSGDADSGARTDSGVGADAGTDAGTFPAAYTGPCTTDTSCGPNAVCFRNGAMTRSYCAPTCVTAATCPAPPAGGTPIVDCLPSVVLGPTGCHLSCNGFTTCPTGMTCSDPLVLPNACF